jgi:carbon-monoxide dehydrogenase iron sulfur subunit
MKRIHLDPIKCDGCKICELNCSFKHFGVFSHNISNCHVEAFEDNCDFTPYNCIQCEERNCINACPVGALTIDDKTGAIKVDHDICIRCGMCIQVCEHNGIRLITIDGEKRIAVCDLCGGDPQCVHFCYLGAISYKE